MPAKSTPSTSMKPKKSFLPFLSKAKSVGGEKKGRKEKEVKKLRSHNSMSEELKRIISGNDVSKNEQVPPVPRLQIQGPSPNLGTISPSFPQTSPSMPQYHTVHVPSREFPNMSLSSRTTTATSSTVSSLRSRSRTTTCPSTSSEYSNVLPKSHKRPARPPPLPRPDVRTAFHQPDDDPSPSIFDTRSPSAGSWRRDRESYGRRPTITFASKEDSENASQTLFNSHIIFRSFIASIPSKRRQGFSCGVLPVPFAEISAFPLLFAFLDATFGSQVAPKSRFYAHDPTGGKKSLERTRGRVRHGKMFFGRGQSLTLPLEDSTAAGVNEICPVEFGPFQLAPRQETK
ncbi:hypothetical protein BT69DRAFT_1294063 [Atractiella rhizophila]|nr:hypothetical protein BT69DRAFT_1294063 [Atractiella rhizophila]